MSIDWDYERSRCWCPASDGGGKQAMTDTLSDADLWVWASSQLEAHTDCDCSNCALARGVLRLLAENKQLKRVIETLATSKSMAKRIIVQAEAPRE